MMMSLYKAHTVKTNLDYLTQPRSDAYSGVVVSHENRKFSGFLFIFLTYGCYSNSTTSIIDSHGGFNI